jgi:DNA-3-methyladenine glycosylase II
VETIKIKGPYNFDKVLDRHALDPLRVVNKADRTAKVPLILNHSSFVAEIKATGTIDEPEFQITGIDNNEEALNRISHLFQWDVPLHEIHCFFLKTDLKPIFEEQKGTPLILDFDPYSCLLKCIIHQQLNLAFAHTLTERFVKTFGFEEEGVYFFPQAEKVAELKVEELRKLQFSGRKAEYVIGVARAIVDGALNLENLHDKTDEEIMAELVKLRGVGPWTVENFLLFGLGRQNLFPMADIGIQNALKKLYQLDRKPTVEEMNQYKKNWEPYLSYASLYLWRSIEPNP